MAKYFFGKKSQHGCKLRNIWVLKKQGGAPTHIQGETETPARGNENMHKEGMDTRTGGDRNSHEGGMYNTQGGGAEKHINFVTDRHTDRHRFI